MTDSSAKPAYNLTQSNPIHPLLHVNALRPFSSLLWLYTGKFLLASSSYATAEAFLFFAFLVERETRE